MCYIASNTKPEKQIIERFEATMLIPELYEPYYFAAGYMYPNLYCIPMDDPQHIYPMEWGLIPKWSENNIEKFRNSKYKTWNAKGEEVFQKKTYQDPAQHRRCLIIADGFFEPHYPDNNFKGKAEPKYCYLPNHQLFAFAGLYNKIGNGDIDMDGDTDFSVTLLTTEANDFFKYVHNKKKRMPLVLDPELEGEWLNPNLTQKQIEEFIPHAFINEDFKEHTVPNFYSQDVDTNSKSVILPN